MNAKLLTQIIFACLIASTNSTSAQTVPPEIIDTQKPPPGFVRPKATEPHDLSMAKYAKESFLDGEEGVVALRLHIRRDGSVAESEITTSSGNKRLDQYAIDTVKDWRYQPATLNSAPVDAW